MKINLEELNQRWIDVCQSNSFKYGGAQEFISELHSYSASDKKMLLPLYREIGQKLSDRGANTPNYNLVEFEEETKKSRKENVEPTTNDDFDLKLKEFIDFTKEEFKILRRYMLLRLGHENEGKTRVLLFHDIHSKAPIFDNIQEKFSNCCDLIDVESFIENRESYKDLKYKKYICLLSLSQRPDLEFIDHLIRNIEHHFGTLEQIVVNNNGGAFDYVNNKDDILDEIKYLVGIDLFNQELSEGEEKIIKKFFRGNDCHSVQYKLLHTGFSGSKVLSVHPYSSNSGSLVKSVIKISEIDSSKLKEEGRNFNQCIKGRDNIYSIEHAQTEEHLAIKYYYASDDGKIESEPFSKIIDAQPTSTISIIENLFNIPLFKTWKKGIKKTPRFGLNEYYKNQIKRGRIENAILKISNQKKEEIALLQTIEKVLSCEIGANRKVCHGDLHTDNFFIDEKGNVFLIDFGDTGEHHAVIDSTTLECAIKFRHIPKYIELDLLLEIEKELLEPETFNSDYQFINIHRDDLRKYFTLINKIRELSAENVYDKKSKTDYLISLFLMTIRQIPYDDLNQLYAFKTAELLGNRIMQLTDIGVESK